MRAFAGQLIRYGLASGLALALDWGLMVALTELFGVHYLAAATAGFTAGAALAYGLSVGFVFTDRRVTDRRAEFALFVLIGLVGLAVNGALLHAAVRWGGLHYAVAKGPVAIAVFSLNFLLRRSLLFSAAPRGAAA